MKFLGIDLGWQSQPSGLCCLTWQNERLCLVELHRLKEISAILDWIDAHIGASEPGGIAVDAPTLITNATGMRLPDRLAHKYFGRYHAGCYPANLGRPFAARTTGFGASLEARGFVHAPAIQPQQPRRFQIEVFPHPATIHLFHLERILKYKKGRLAERRAELLRLRDYILTVLPTLEPALDYSDDAIAHVSHIPTTTLSLKALEDQLDSLICAYVAAHWWYWGQERNWVLGESTPEKSQLTGYIIVPAPSKSTLVGTAQHPALSSE
jgi:predicted RNase H-like nuclease